MNNIMMFLCVILFSIFRIGYSQDYVFNFKEIPNFEDSSTIAQRDLALQEFYNQYFEQLCTDIKAGNGLLWLEEKLKDHRGLTDQTIYNRAHALVNYYFISNEYENLKNLKKPIVRLAKDGLENAFIIYNNQIKKDHEKNRYRSQIHDLNTAQPAASVLIYSYILAKEKKLSTSKEKIVKAFIKNNIEEGKSHFFSGKFKTTGYNKEIFAMDVAFWLKMLYPKSNELYPKTFSSFESFWTNVLEESYDADNSPHYDANTGFKLILKMGVLLGREDQLKSSPHIQRIMQRMMNTTMNSGQTANWGKCMTNYIDRGGNEIYSDGGPELSWCLKMGYRLFKNPNYLYVARKYEALRKFNLAKKSDRFSTSLDREVFLWPHLPSYNQQKTSLPTFPLHEVPSSIDYYNENTSRATKRITSRLYYGGKKYIDGGTILGRGDTTYKNVQDKVILTTGQHPDAPYLLMDLSFTGHKATADHRVGIDNFIYKSTHVSTRNMRKGEANKGNTVFIAPLSAFKQPASSTYPIVNTKSDEVVPNKEYLKKVRYTEENAYMAYVIDSYEARDLVKDTAAYAKIKYKKYQQDGVSLQREVVLLHNGIVAVLDKITTDKSIKSELLAGTIYQIWPSFESKSTEQNWVIQTPHKRTSLDTDDLEKSKHFKTLYYFPNFDNGICDLKKDDSYDSKNYVLSKHKKIDKDESLEILSFIIPMKLETEGNKLVSKIKTEKINGTYITKIPYVKNSSLTIRIGGLEKPSVWIE